MRDHEKGSAREGGEARIRRAMERAEREHRRNRKNAIVAAVVGALLVFAVGAGVLSRLGAASALAVDSQQPAPVRSAAIVPTAAIEPSSQISVEESVATDPAPVAERPKKPKTVVTQRLSIRIGESGYEPSVVRASAGRPITLVVEQGEGCAAGFLMPSLGVAADNSSGPATVKLGTLKRGTYRFTCGMEMVEGKLVVR